MDQPNRAHRELAGRLLAREQPGETAATRAAAAVRVYVKISLRLSPLVGATGVRALFARSLVLTIAEYPFLAAADFERPETAVSTLQALLLGQHPDVILRGSSALFGAFLTLLATYVGERLTMQVLRGAWPDLVEPPPKEVDR